LLLTLAEGKLFFLEFSRYFPLIAGFFDILFFCLCLRRVIALGLHLFFGFGVLLGCDLWFLPFGNRPENMLFLTSFLSSIGLWLLADTNINLTRK